MHRVVPDTLRIVMGEMRALTGGCVFLQVNFSCLATIPTKDRPTPCAIAGRIQALQQM